MPNYSQGTSGNYVGPYSSSYYPAYQSGSTPSSSGSMWGNSNMWGAVLNGISSYANQQSQNRMLQQQSQMSAQARKELTQMQREYDKQDVEYKKKAVSKYKKYFKKT